MQLVPHPPDRLQRRLRRGAVGGNRHGESVDHDILRRNAVFFRRGVDFARDTDASVRIRGNPALVDGKADQDAAILLHERQDRLDLILFPVHGIDHRFAVVASQRALQRLRIRRVDLQRQRRDALQLRNHVLHHRRLINLRQPDIDIQDVRAGVLLLERLSAEIIEVVAAERLLEFLLARGIDPLADNHRARADLHRARKAGDDRAVLRRIRTEWQTTHHRDRAPDMLRCGAAATAHRLHAERGNLSHPAGKIRGAHVIHCPSFVVRAGKSGIGIHQNRHRGRLHQLLHDRNHLLRTESAVDPERIDAESFQHRDDRGHRAAREQLARAIVNRSNQNRQITVLLCRKNRRLRLIGIAHRLDEHEIRACCRTDAHRLSEETHRFLKRQIAHGRKQLPCRTDIQRDVCILSARARARLLCKADRRCHNLLQIIRIFQPVRAERIRIENITARLKISHVKLPDIVRMRQVPGLRQLSSRKPFCLQQCSHAAVKEHPFLSQPVHQFCAHLISFP